MNNIFLFLGFLSTSLAAPDSLRMVNLLYRHGDRSAVGKGYPNDPVQEADWPQGYGWLSTRGMQQQYALGQWLRSEYDTILSKRYSNKEITVEASMVDRCLMSAYSNLAGLYPPEGPQVWNPKLPWQPIPVHTRPQKEDNKLAIQAPCATYKELYAKELHSDVITQEEKDNADFYQYIDKVSGIKRENISEVWQIADALYCESQHNFTLPNWTQTAWTTTTRNTTVYEYLRILNDWAFSLLYHGPDLSRLKGGPLLKEMIENMQAFKNDPSGEHYKMYMYSAHDTTVAALLGAMSVFNHMAPPYATVVLVELHETNNALCVQMRLRNDTSRAPYILQHPACNVDCCPLYKFITATKARVPEDWDAECQNSPSAPTNGQPILTSQSYIGLVFRLFLALVLICNPIYW